MRVVNQYGEVITSDARYWMSDEKKGDFSLKNKINSIIHSPTKTIHYDNEMCLNLNNCLNTLQYPTPSLVSQC